MSTRQKRRDNQCWQVQHLPFAMTKDIVTDMFPVEMEPRSNDGQTPYDRKCLSGVANRGRRFPAVPIALKDQIKEQVKSLKAGAIIAHVHARDPKTGEAQMNHKLLQKFWMVFLLRQGIVSYSPIPGTQCLTPTWTASLAREMLKWGMATNTFRDLCWFPLVICVRGNRRLLARGR